MADPNRIHHIIIEWSRPSRLDNIDANWKCVKNGLYYISRKFGNVESPIYIGETKRDFITRINEHYRDVSEFLNKRGEKYIRLGTIIKPKSLSSYNDLEFKHLLQTIESELVKDLYLRGKANALCNIRQVLSYTQWFQLYIENEGCRGELSPELPYIEE
ncbi:MAG: hypothetical protein K2K49_02300 [Duncaniella sp.]|nr:hypothetical protein [Duncaniella sp.]